MDHMQFSKPETGRQLADTIRVRRLALRAFRVMPAMYIWVAHVNVFIPAGGLRRQLPTLRHALGPSPRSPTALLGRTGLNVAAEARVTLRPHQGREVAGSADGGPMGPVPLPSQGC